MLMMLLLREAWLAGCERPAFYAIGRGVGSVGDGGEPARDEQAYSGAQRSGQ